MWRGVEERKVKPPGGTGGLGEGLGGKPFIGKGRSPNRRRSSDSCSDSWRKGGIIKLGGLGGRLLFPYLKLLC